MPHLRVRHTVALLLTLASTGGTQQTTPSTTPAQAASTNPCNAKKVMDIRGELVPSDGIITVEPPADTVLFIPEGDHILRGQSLRILANVVCVTGKARILAFDENQAQAAKSGTPDAMGQAGTSETGATGRTGAEGNRGDPARLIELFVTGKVTGGGTLTVINNGMKGGQGQQGGQGGQGGDGNRGRKAGCYGGGRAGKGGPAGRGGTGGTGGPGSVGGNGGPIVYNAVVKKAMDSGVVNLSAPGGKGGDPGPGGQPGGPGQPGPGGHGNCGYGGGDPGDPNVAGPRGDSGSAGKDGEAGQIKLAGS